MALLEQKEYVLILNHPLFHFRTSLQRLCLSLLTPHSTPERPVSPWSHLPSRKTLGWFSTNHPAGCLRLFFVRPFVCSFPLHPQLLLSSRSTLACRDHESSSYSEESLQAPRYPQIDDIESSCRPDSHHLRVAFLVIYLLL